MQTDPDATRIVRSWLDLGATMLPDRVLDAVLDQIPATPQRRSWWPARRSYEMNTPWKLAISAAAVAVVVMATIAFTALPGAGGAGGSPAVLPPTAVPTPKPTPTVAVPTPGVSPTAAPTAVAPAPSPAAEDRWPGTYPAPAGRYSWTPTAGGRSSWMHSIPSHLRMTMEISDAAFRPGLMGVTVGGYPATYQMLPAKKSKEVRERHVWIVDVDGTPVTIVLYVGVEASEADLAEGMAIVASMAFEPTASKLGFRIAFDLQAGWDSA